MNLSTLQRMIREGDLSSHASRFLIQCRSECEWLDYKESLVIDHDAEIAAFVKDVLAMKNAGGGYIVVGVRDKTWEPVGQDDPIPYDGKMLRDKIRKGCGLDLAIDVVSHELDLTGRDRWYSIIYIRSAVLRNRRRLPSVVKRDFAPRKNFGLRQGEIYVRRGDETLRLTSLEELGSVLDDLEARADQDALNENSRAESAFAVETGTYRLLERGFDKFIGRRKLRDDLVTAITKDPRLWIINVHGPGGVGKSALVTQAAYDLYEAHEFESIIQLTAKETVLTAEGISRATGRSLYSLENLLDQIVRVFEETPPSSLEDKQALATEILSTWKTLLVLDNMETVHDGRILKFIQDLPSDTRAKVVLTSRQRTGGWEYPLPVRELSNDEVREFVDEKARELDLQLPITVPYEQIRRASGGLALAIQWILGQYAKTGQMRQALSDVDHRDSPILEFSFRNIWNILSSDARMLLVVLTIFESPPGKQQLAIATEWPQERIDAALDELSHVTLVSSFTQSSDGRVTYTALPITIAFARHQGDQFGDFEIDSRRRSLQFEQQMQLRDYEMQRFSSTFDRYQITSDNEKRAVILVRRGESETFAGREDQAAELFAQARALAPQSSYVYAMSANFELTRQRVGGALAFANEACRRATKATGAFCYVVKARVLDMQRDREGRILALKEALEFDPADLMSRHQYGVALSRVGRSREAIDQFTKIIDSEERRTTPSETLLMAYKTRIINLRRLGDNELAGADLERAEELLAKNPQLYRQRHHISELRDEE